MFCPNCGKSNPDDSKFCESCGTNMLEPVVAAAPQPAYTPPPVTSTPAPAYAPPVQPAYAPPPQAQYYPPQNGAAADPRTKPLGVGGYLGMFALNIIPFVGPLIFFIMLFVWAFGSKANINKKNFSRAWLLLMLIMIVVYVVIMVVFSSTMMPFIQDILKQLGYEMTY